MTQKLLAEIWFESSNRPAVLNVKDEPGTHDRLVTNLSPPCTVICLLTILLVG